MPTNLHLEQDLLRHTTASRIRRAINNVLAPYADARRMGVAAAFLWLTALPVSAASIADLDWLAGCWAGGDGDHVVEEHWMAPAGGTMLGVSRTVSGNTTRGFEFMRIEEADGRLVFIARPSGQEGASFPSIEVAAGRVVFENTGHDFPQRVIYRLQEDGALLGRIEGMVEGRLEAVDFPLRSRPCPGRGP